MSKPEREFDDFDLGGCEEGGEEDYLDREDEAPDEPDPEGDEFIRDHIIGLSPAAVKKIIEDTPF